MFRIEKKENIMAKYLDQAGVQHLAEALVQNTKTVGGQSIWGSGNIETAESGNLITISTVGDFTTYKTQLESKIPKSVSIEPGDYDLTDQSINICNAILQINGNVRLKNATEIRLFGCMTGTYEADPVGVAGVLLYINAGQITFNRCQMTLRSSPFLENNTNLSAEHIYITDSRLKIIPITDTQFNNGVSNIVNSGIVIVQSECIGLIPNGASTIIFRGLSEPGIFYTYLCNTMINCNFKNMATFNNNTACTNTRFIGCYFGEFKRNIYNITQSWVPASGVRMFAGPPGTSFTAQEYGFNNTWSAS